MLTVEVDEASARVVKCLKAREVPLLAALLHQCCPPLPPQEVCVPDDVGGKRSRLGGRGLVGLGGLLLLGCNSGRLDGGGRGLQVDKGGA